MEKALKRVPIRVATDEKGNASGKEYERYKLQTRGEYEDLMMEFEFRCKRAAMMNYYEASGYDRKVYHMEILAAFLGTVSVSSIGVWLSQGRQEINFTHLGTLGLLGLGAAILVELLGKGSSKVIPSFSKRAQSHICAAAAWSRLAMKTRSYRIQLDNPNLDVAVYAEWYDNLIAKREELCSSVIIPQSTYRLYCDPQRVYKPMKKRRQMFLKFIELEDSTLEDFDGQDVEV